ncbi:MAG: hypothetical protein ABIH42_02750, partial [Planctomycetota bacterium]
MLTKKCKQKQHNSENIILKSETNCFLSLLKIMIILSFFLTVGCYMPRAPLIPTSNIVKDKLNLGVTYIKGNPYEYTVEETHTVYNRGNNYHTERIDTTTEVRRYDIQGIVVSGVYGYSDIYGIFAAIESAEYREESKYERLHTDICSFSIGVAYDLDNLLNWIGIEYSDNSVIDIVGYIGAESFARIERYRNDFDDLEKSNDEFSLDSWCRAGLQGNIRVVKGLDLILFLDT